jgi:Flp pilus assembly protein CpaB
MKATYLFAITISVFLGLAVVAAAKYTGVFEPRAHAEEKKEEPIQILVARQNLFEGVTLTASQVRVRPIRPEEMAHYLANKDKYLPPLTEAGHLRVMARNVGADLPILKEDLQDQSLPDRLGLRLEPGMRAVNVIVPKERAGGGLIQLSEHVDVLLTTTIFQGGHAEDALTLTAPIARDLKVIVKRNNLWTVMAAADDGPAQYTLQANPYRAALINYAQQKGMLTLEVVPNQPLRGFSNPVSSAGGSFADPESAEYRDEDRRVAGILSGELTVGDQDLERIFHLRARPALEPPEQPLKVVRFSGNTLMGTTIFNPDGSQVRQVSATGSTTYTPATQSGGFGYQFVSPEDPLPKSGPGSPGYCPECEAAKKRAKRS